MSDLRKQGLISVIPANAGIQGRTRHRSVLVTLAPRFRGGDGEGAVFIEGLLYIIALKFSAPLRALSAILTNSFMVVRISSEAVALLSLILARD